MAKLLDDMFKQYNDIKYLMKDDDYFRCWRIKNESQRKLMDSIPAEMKDAFKEFIMADNEMRYLEHKEQFVKGFRKGAKFTYEAFYDKRYCK